MNSKTKKDELGDATEIEQWVTHCLWMDGWIDDGMNGWMDGKSFTKNNHDVLYFM
jgi:hypothetical protein